MIGPNVDPHPMKIEFIYKFIFFIISLFLNKSVVKFCDTFFNWKQIILKSHIRIN